MNVFSATCYKSLIMDWVNYKKKMVGSIFNYQQMAKYCNIQKTYISKVLNREDTHFSHDQLFKICEFLKMDEDETEFALNLLDLEKSINEQRRVYLKKKIEKSRSKKLKTDEHIQVEELKKTDDLEKKYYLNPYYQIIHIYLTISKYAKNPDLIKKRLAISDSIFSDALETLEGLGIISIIAGKNGNHIINNNKSLHLSETSDLFTPYSLGIKSLGNSKFYSTDASERFNFSVVFSADETTKNKVRLKFLDFLKEVKPMVEKANTESVHQMDFSLFNW